MKHILIYLRLEMKKGMKLIPFFLLSIFITAAAVAAAAFAVSFVMGKDSALPKAEVAIVTGSDGSDDTIDKEGRLDLKTMMMIGVVENMESVKSVSHFSYMSPKKAADSLKDGSVQAAVYLPDDVYENINNGTNTPVLVRLSSKNGGLLSGLFRALVNSGVTLIQTVETAIYSIDYLSETYPLSDKLSALEDKIFGAYVAAALARGSIWRTENVSDAFGGISLPGFYMISAILLILLLFGAGFDLFYTKSEKATQKVLRRKGLPVPLTSLAKAASVFCVLAVFGLLLVFAASLLAGAFPGIFGAAGAASAAASSAASGAAGAGAASAAGAISGTAGAGLSMILRAACGRLPWMLPGILAAAFVAACYLHLIYSLVPEKGGSLICVLLTLLLFFLCGGLVPAGYLPGFLKNISAFTPVGAAQKMIGHALGLADSGAYTADLVRALIVGFAMLVPPLILHLLLPDGKPAEYRNYGHGTGAARMDNVSGTDGTGAARADNVSGAAGTGAARADNVYGAAETGAARADNVYGAAGTSAARMDNAYGAAETGAAQADNVSGSAGTGAARAAAKPSPLHTAFLRFRILLKAELRTPGCLALTAAAVILLLVISGTVVPSASNNRIGLVTDGGTYADLVSGKLLQNEGVFEYEQYTDTDDLTEAVRNGRVDCGFILGADLDHAVLEGEWKAAGSDMSVPSLKECVGYVCTTSTTKGEAAKEEVFSTLFSYLSDSIMDKAVRDGAIFKDTSDAAVEAVLSEMDRIAENNETFTVTFEDVSGSAVAASKAGEAAGSEAAIQASGEAVGDDAAIQASGEAVGDDAAIQASGGAVGNDAAIQASGEAARGGSKLLSIAAVLIFAAGLFFAQTKFYPEQAAVTRYLRGSGALYRILAVFAPLLIFTAAIMLAASAADGGFTAFALLLLPLSAACAVWAAVFTGFFRNRTICLFVSAAVILAAAVLNPNLTGVPLLPGASSWLRVLLPGTWI